MPTATIRWSKRYYEDLGPQGESGSYEYAYRYFIYSFHSPTGSSITVRQYREEPEEGSLFVYTQGYEVGAKKAIEQEISFISAVVGFLKTSEKITRFYYFNAGSGYKPLDVTKLPSTRRTFFFTQVPEKA